MIRVGIYTGNWQEALKPTAPKVGTLVSIEEYGDEREYHDFSNCLRREGLTLTYLRPSRKLGYFTYRVVLEKNFQED